MKKRPAKGAKSYRWKGHPRNAKLVEAEDAYRELLRIKRRRGALVPEAIIEESRSNDAVLHPMLTWDDDEAAHQCRLAEARAIVQSIVVIDEEEHEEPSFASVPVRVMDVKKSHEYEEINVARNNKDAAIDVVKQLRGWYPRVAAFPVLASLASSLDRALTKVEGELGITTRRTR